MHYRTYENLNRNLENRTGNRPQVPSVRPLLFTRLTREFLRQAARSETYRT